MTLPWAPQMVLPVSLVEWVQRTGVGVGACSTALLAQNLLPAPAGGGGVLCRPGRPGLWLCPWSRLSVGIVQGTLELCSEGPERPSRTRPAVSA